MDYDIKLSKQFRDIAIIDYGIVNGNDTVVFIKVGQNGSIYGYENKYLRIAHNLHSKYGYTVICASNPFDGNNPLDNDFSVVEDYCKENGIDDYEIYYFGHSNGARIGIAWGYQYPRIRKMVLVNSPIFINFNSLKDGLNNIDNKKVFLVYGEYDQSVSYTELFKPLLNGNIKLEIVKGADHDFTNMLDEFMKLPDKYF